MKIKSIEEFYAEGEKQRVKELMEKPKCPNVLCIGNEAGRCDEEMISSGGRKSVVLCKKRKLFIHLKDDCKKSIEERLRVI
jgi:hypothetical protein